MTPNLIDPHEFNRRIEHSLEIANSEIYWEDNGRPKLGSVHIPAILDDGKITHIILRVDAGPLHRYIGLSWEAPLDTRSNLVKHGNFDNFESYLAYVYAIHWFYDYEVIEMAQSMTLSPPAINWRDQRLASGLPHSFDRLVKAVGYQVWIAPGFR